MPRPMLQIERQDQIRVLASTVRHALFDALDAAGPCSVSELAAIFGWPADGLYYHLRILCRSGLVVEEEVENAAGRLQSLFDLPARPVRLRYVPESRRNARAVVKVVGSMLRSAHRSFERAFAAGAVVEGPRRTLWAGRKAAWLSSEQLQEVNTCLQRITEVMESGRRQGSTLYAITFVLSPFGRGQRTDVRRR